MSRHYIAETLLNVMFNYKKYKLWYLTYFGLSKVTCMDHIVLNDSICVVVTFYAPSLKGPPRASSIWIICLSIIPYHLHTKCNILSLGGDTVTKLGLLSYVNFTHTSLTSHAPGGRGRILPDLDFLAARGIHVSQSLLVAFKATIREV